jgi:hypothetical protein
LLQLSSPDLYTCCILVIETILRQLEGGKTTLGAESVVSKTHFYQGDVHHNCCCLLVFFVVVALGVLVVVFVLSKGLVMAVALGKVALPGVLIVVVVVEELVVVVALGVLVVGVALIILVVVVAPGILANAVVIGVLVVFIALGILVVNIIGEGLVIVVSEYGRVIIIDALGEKLFVAVVTNRIFVVVIGDVALLLGYFDGSWVMFVLFVIQLAAPNKETGPPHTLRHGLASSPSSLASLTLTID